MATIKDVARRAGVAISTVSAVINRSAPVSEDTIQKVQQAISDVGYIQHGAARSLRVGQSRLIGLVVPNIANPHFAAVARVVENACLKAGYMTVVYSTGQDSLRESEVLTMMRVQRVAGLIVIPTRSDKEHGSRLINLIHVPTILLDMYVEGLPYTVIKSDNIEAGRLAADHLLSLGHRKIGIITGIAGLATSDDRYAGYVKAHEEHGALIETQLSIPGDFDQEKAFESTLQLMSHDLRPTAIIAISNMMTVGMLFALKSLKLKIPDEISVIGIDDLEFSAIIDPPPTVVVTPILQMARRAIDLLLLRIATKQSDSGQWEVLQPQLLARESCLPFHQN